MRKYLALMIVAMLAVSVGAAVAQGLQNVELHGYMQNRLYVNPDSSSRWVPERISLSATGQVGADGTAYVEVYFHPWLTDKVSPTGITAEEFRTYIESAYVDLPLGPGRVRIGKGRQLCFGMTPTYPNRKTTQYGIVAETFTQDRIVGAQYVIKRGALDFGASMYTDQRVGTRRIGEFAGAITSGPDTQVVQHFADRDIPGNITGELAYSAKLGVATPCFQAHVSGAIGKLTPDDAAFIATPYILGGQIVDPTDDSHNKYGVDASWSTGPFVLQGEWYQGNFGFLKVTGWQVLAGYQPKDKARFYARYSALNNDRSPVIGTVGGASNLQQFTWDTRQLTFGIVQPIRKGVWVEFEYEKNWAAEGNVDNDLLFVEFFTGF